MNLKKINNFLEKFWLVVGVGTMIYGIYLVNQTSLSESYMYLIYPIIAFVLFGFRYTLRKRLERAEEQ